MNTVITDVIQRSNESPDRLCWITTGNQRTYSFTHTLHTVYCRFVTGQFNRRNGVELTDGDFTEDYRFDQKRCKVCGTQDVVHGALYLGDTEADVKARRDAEEQQQAQESRRRKFANALEAAPHNADRSALNTLLARHREEYDNLRSAAYQQELASVRTEYSDIAPLHTCGIAMVPSTPEDFVGSDATPQSHPWHCLKCQVLSA